MFETAIVRIYGKLWLFQAADNLARKSAERNRTPGTDSPLLPAGQTTRRGIAVPQSDVPARSFDQPPHSTGIRRGH